MDLCPKQGDLGIIKVRRPRIGHLPYSFRRQGLYLLLMRDLRLIGIFCFDC